MGLKTIAAASILTLSLQAPAVWAEEHQHEGDIQPWLANGKVVLNAALFEADFGDLPGGLYRTDDPGFDADTAQGAFGAGNWLWLEGLGTLKYWNGSSWGAPVAGETVRIDDALGDTTDPTDDTIFSAAGVSKPLGVVGQFDSLGDLHEHLDFYVRTSTGSLGGTAGAYWITLRLFETLPNSFAPIGTPSDAFHIIFNRGLALDDFETAVAAVPVPPSVFLLGSACAALFGLRRRTLSA